MVLLLAQRLSKRGAVAGLTPVEWRILAELSDHQNLSLTDLAQQAGLRKGSVSRSLRTLQRLGLADWYRPSSQDRVYAITLTARGREACDLAQQQGALTSPFKGLDYTQKQLILELLRLAASSQPDG